jgi:hypothetical protein
MAFEIETLGFEQLQQALASGNEVAQQALDASLLKQGNIILTDARLHCPVDTGALRASGTVRREEGDVLVGFGGPSAPYALYVHERTDLHHPEGEAKFLENAFNRWRGDWKEKVTADVRTYLKANLPLAKSGGFK